MAIIVAPGTNGCCSVFGFIFEIVVGYGIRENISRCRRVAVRDAARKERRLELLRRSHSATSRVGHWTATMKRSARTSTEHGKLMKKRSGGAVTRRQWIGQDSLLEILLAAIGRRIRDTNLLREQINIRPSGGKPIWEASLRHTRGPAAAEGSKKRGQPCGRFTTSIGRELAGLHDAPPLPRRRGRSTR